jgi:large subunit ribosomal protein L4
VSELTVDLLNMQGSKSGTLELNKNIFDSTIYHDLVHQVVRWQLAKRRQGTHSTLNRTAIEGGGKKPFKQKGTGNARAGSRLSPLWRGGAVIFGPTPRSYEFKVPKKVRANALRSALTSKMRTGAMLFVTDYQLSENKTKMAAESLKSLGCDGKKILCIVPASHLLEQSFVRAARNLPNVKIISVDGLNVYDILCAKKIVISKEVVDKINDRLCCSECTTEKKAA